MTRIVIAGGGLAGCLAALALRQKRPDVELLLVEQERTFGGNHTWSFFDTDVPLQQRWLLDGLVHRRWPDHEIRFPARQRVIPLGYNSIRSRDLDAATRRVLGPHQYRLGTSIQEVSEAEVVLGSGERIGADAVLDARGPSEMTGLDLGWQKFVGRVYRFAEGHRCERPVIMDATVDQQDGYRFVYLLPFTATELLIEDTYYSTSTQLDRQALGNGIDQIAAKIGNAPQQVEEETGVLPVLLGGELSALWSGGGEVGRLGLRGGFFHPTTGYSLPDAVTNAVLLTQQRDLSSPALHAFFRSRAERLWRDRHFFQLLNRMLFRAADPADRYRVLEHFYRLSTPLIGRFYGARLTGLDKLRIVSGRPPVPIGRALSSIRSKAA
ncbi:MAG TPA: lycopene beta-cyclase CrtY [Sphingomicrobium sp.]|jgi:lycopene beta-cyclase